MSTKILPKWMTPLEPVVAYDDKAPRRDLPQGPQRDQADIEGWSNTFRATIARQQETIEALRDWQENQKWPPPYWLREVIEYIYTAAAKHPGCPPRGDSWIGGTRMTELEEKVRSWNDSGTQGSWQSAVLEEAIEYATEEDPAKRRIELLQCIAVQLRALEAMDSSDHKESK